MSRTCTALILATIVAVTPASAQPAIPGVPDTARVATGSYAADPRHSQIVWTLNHLGFSEFTGIIGGVAGTLMFDAAHPAATTVAVEIPLSGMTTPVPALNEHLAKADFFDTARFPSASFKSTSVIIGGTTAKISGLLTLHGVTHPVVLDARFVGAGTNPLSKKMTVGFEATTVLKRSDYGMITLLPALGDSVELRIAASFERIS